MNNNVLFPYSGRNMTIPILTETDLNLLTLNLSRYVPDLVYGNNHRSKINFAPTVLTEADC